MHSNIQLIILGSAAGAMLALLASGLVVIYRSSQVLNFAQGALATVATYCFIRASAEWGWPLALAMAFGIAVTMVIGGLFQILVVRNLRDAAPLAKVAATLGLLVAVTGSIRPIFGEHDPQAVTIISSDRYTLPFGSPQFYITKDRFWLVVIAVVLMTGLWALYRFTRFGRATRAAADNERATAMLGLSPRNLEFLNWLLGSALAAIAGILLSDLVQPNPVNYNAVIIGAIAVAVIGGFQSFSLMLVVGTLIGGAQAVLLRYSLDLEELTTLGGWSQALPLLLIAGAVMISGRGIPFKASEMTKALPRSVAVSRPLQGAAVLLVGGVIWFLVAPVGLADATTATLVGTVLALSVVVVTGLGGQISLAQVSLAGIGAFTTARLATDVGMPFPLPVLLAGLAAVPVGFLIGLPALRVRGLNLAVITLGFAVVLDVMFFADRELTEADSGLRVASAELGPIDLNGLSEPRAFGICVLVFTIATGLAVAYLRRSSLGVAMLAVRANERGAAATGMSVMRTKLIAFSIAAFIAGVGGSLHGYRSIQLSWTTFAFTASILLVAYTYMGGITRISGAFVAGLFISGGVVSYIFNFQGTAERVIEILGGVGVMITVVLHRDGLSSLPERLVRKIRARRRGGDEAPAPSGVATSTSAVEPVGSRAE